ncbi:IclR family transcriptional regulator [Roseomonas sp. SSH11]|uniref:IclR family transcriptional regulator n=1 Tax=Pararoseomonas baculiformis TaxID=2820812 RepID=A0ABS4A927_9PROT|nr:IclR family transcriptional regulator [Pararoseomonas baculiformis]MBP0443505.1 IclR family transcriptional regulator [Pararoseomonas baculiformis]
MARTKAAPPQADEAKDRQFVTALARGLQLLQCFTPDQPELSGSDLARMTKLPQPTVWRLCHTMLEMGVLVTVAGEKLRPGLAALRLGHSAIAGLGIAEVARPHLQELADAFEGAGGLAARDGVDMVMLQRCESNNRLLLNLRVGSRVPLSSSALGWAWLAGVSDEERARAIAEMEAKDGPRWEKARAGFAQALAEYRARGFIINNGVLHKGYNTAAAPLLGPDGSVPYAINCGSASVTLSVARLRSDVGPRLAELAEALRHALTRQEMKSQSRLLMS